MSLWCRFTTIEARGGKRIAAFNHLVHTVMGRSSACSDVAIDVERKGISDSDVWTSRGSLGEWKREHR